MDSSNSSNTTTPKFTISVGKEFQHLTATLNNLREKHALSRFVCEAIDEKLRRKDNPGAEAVEMIENYRKLQEVFQHVFDTNSVPIPTPATPVVKQETIRTTEVPLKEEVEQAPILKEPEPEPETKPSVTPVDIIEEKNEPPVPEIIKQEISEPKTISTTKKPKLINVEKEKDAQVAEAKEKVLRRLYKSNT